VRAGKHGHVRTNVVHSTLPLISYTVGDWNEMHLACIEGKTFFIRRAQLGMRPACDVWSRACRACDRGVTCCQVEVAARCLLLLQLRTLSMGLKTSMSGGFNAASRWRVRTPGE